MKQIRDRQYRAIHGHIKPAQIERELVEVVVKELRERCQKCGRLVNFTQYNANDRYRYVICPECGQKHALGLIDDTIRPLS